jgi:hypothetical protein
MPKELLLALLSSALFFFEVRCLQKRSAVLPKVMKEGMVLNY